MSQQAQDPAGAPPSPSGEQAVDQAVAGLDDLEQLPLAEHHDRLTRAHEQLHAALSRDAEQSSPA